MEPGIMDSRAAADFLGIHEKTLLKKARIGDIPGARVGRHWRFMRDQLNDWLLGGGTARERIEDEGLRIVMTERQADPANQRTLPLEQVLQERGL